MTKLKGSSLNNEPIRHRWIISVLHVKNQWRKQIDTTKQRHYRHKTTWKKGKKDLVPQRSHHRMAPLAHGPTPHVAPPAHGPTCGPHQGACSHIHLALHVNMDPPLRSHMWAPPALGPTWGPHERIVPRVGPTSTWSHMWAHQRLVPHVDPTSTWSHMWGHQRMVHMWAHTKQFGYFSFIQTPDLMILFFQNFTKPNIFIWNFLKFLKFKITLDFTKILKTKKIPILSIMKRSTILLL
jgi:hypothetical protein